MSEWSSKRNWKSFVIVFTVLWHLSKAFSSLTLILNWSLEFSVKIKTFELIAELSLCNQFAITRCNRLYRFNSFLNWKALFSAFCENMTKPSLIGHASELLAFSSFDCFEINTEQSASPFLFIIIRYEYQSWFYLPKSRSKIIFIKDVIELAIVLFSHFISLFLIVDGVDRKVHPKNVMWLQQQSIYLSLQTFIIAIKCNALIRSREKISFQSRWELQSQPIIIHFLRERESQII